MGRSWSYLAPEGRGAQDCAIASQQGHLPIMSCTSIWHRLHTTPDCTVACGTHTGGLGWGVRQTVGQQPQHIPVSNRVQDHMGHVTAARYLWLAYLGDHMGQSCQYGGGTHARLAFVRDHMGPYRWHMPKLSWQYDIAATSCWNKCCA